VQIKCQESSRLARVTRALRWPARNTALCTASSISRESPAARGAVKCRRGPPPRTATGFTEGENTRAVAGTHDHISSAFYRVESSSKNTLLSSKVVLVDANGTLAAAAERLRVEAELSQQRHERSRLRLCGRLRRRYRRERR